MQTNLEIKKAIDDSLNLILSRPDRKQRSLRVTQTLDEEVSNLEKVAKNEEFKLWLYIENPITKKRRFDILRDAWDARDGESLSILFRLFLDQVAGIRPYRYGHQLNGVQKKVGDLIHSDYEVVDLLGVGGFGEVFFVYSHNKNVNSFYALKILKAGVNDEDKVRRFETEARLLLSLEASPYLVSARFIEKIGDQILLVMDYVQPDRNGRTTLQQHIRTGPINLEDQMKWVVECCAALSSAYKNGIQAHRDIKPANIFIDSLKRARIADFGLASLDLISGATKPQILLAPSANKDNSKTIEGSSFGTPAYMSPEQFINSHSCDVRSDIYSIGITMFEMATAGKLPFLPRTDSNANHVNQFAEFGLLHTYKDLPEIKSPLFPIIAKCCEKSPADRFQNIDQLRKAIENVMNTLGFPEVLIYESELSWLEKHNKIGNQAVAHARFGEHEKAIELYKQARDIFDLGPSNFEMGRSYQQLGRYQEALDAYLSIKTDRNADIECGIAYCQVKLFGWEHAIPHYLAATKFDPNQFNAWENLARGYAATSQRTLAADAFDTLTGLSGVQATHWLEKGENEAELNRLSESHKSLMIVIRMCDKTNTKTINKAFKVLGDVNKKGFFYQVKKIVGQGFNDTRLKLSTDALFDTLANGKLEESKAIQNLRGSEPAITYSQAERIFREHMAGRK